MMRTTFSRLMLVAICAALSLPMLAYAEPLTLKQAEVAPPDEVASGMRDLLDSQAVQLLDGDKPIFEIWFRKDIPLKSKPDEGASALSLIDEVTYLGVVSVHERRKDFRNDDIEPGVYTMRLGILPTDGNHLGTSPFPYMAILVPAKYDEGLDAITDHDSLAELSGQDTYAEHPNSLSLQPLEDGEAEGDFPRTGEGGDDWQLVYLKLPAKADGAEVELAFKMVYEGHGEI